MNWRTTLVLAAIAIAVFAYFRFFELKQPNTEEARRQAQNVVKFDRTKNDGVIIQSGDEKIAIRRRDNKWCLEIAIKDQVDSSSIGNLCADPESGWNDAIVAANENERE